MRIIHENSPPKLLNRPEQQSEVVKVQVQESTACFAQQREAQVFSLDHPMYRMKCVNEKKALNQFYFLPGNRG